LNVIITGASRGIGRELVKRYLDKADKIYAIAKDEKRLSELKSVYGEKIIPVALDLANLQEVAKFASSVEKVDEIIFNAAISLPHVNGFTPFEEFKKTFDVNFLSIHAMLEPLIEKIKDSKGKIVLISSLASLAAAPASMPYSASKRALNSYAQSLRNLLAPHGVKVINILPGFIDTDMTKKNDFYMPFLMSLEEGVDRIVYAIENNKKEYAFPKRFYYLIKLFNLLPIDLQDRLLQKTLK